MNATITSMKKGIASLLVVVSAIFFSVPAFAWTNPASNPATGGGSFIAEQNSPASVVYIKSNGNVGIGTTNPTAPLYAYNNTVYATYADGEYPAIFRTNSYVGIKVKADGAGYAPASVVLEANQSTARGQGIYHFNPTSSTLWYSGTTYSSSNDRYIIGYKSSATFTGDVAQNGNAFVTVLSNGNVGIGKTPTTILDVNGTVKATSFEGPITGAVTAPNVSSGQFGANTGGGNYSFPANVGVGTTTPGVKLDVQTAGYGSPVTSGSTQTYGGIRVSPPSASGNVVLDMGTAGGAGTWIQATLRTDHTNNYPLWLNPNGGNVGIGTNAPGQKLDVNGNIKLGDNMMVEGNSSYRTYRNLASYSSDSSGSAGAFVIETNQPWNGPCMFRMRVVGYFYDATAPFDISIGGYMYNTNTFYNYGYTNIGSKKLTVRAGRNVSTGKIAFIIGSEGSTYEYPKMAVAEFSQGYNSINESYADGWSIVRQTALTNYDYLTTFPDTTSVGGSVTSAANVSSGQFGSSTGGGNYSFPANVGIGAVTPGRLLEINTASSSLAAGTAGVLVVGDKNNERFAIESTTPVFQGGAFRGTQAARTATQSGDALAYFQGGGYTGSAQQFNQARMVVVATENESATNQGTSLQFQTTPNGSTSASIATRMTIDNNGNVGVGVTGPSAKLEVADSGTSSFRVGITSNMANTYSQMKGSLAVLAPDASGTSFNGAVAWNFYNNGTSPSWSGTYVQHAGTSVAGNLYGLTAANQGTLVFQNVSTGVIASNGANIFISPLGAVSTTFLTNGNVGIGTTSPLTKAHIEGSQISTFTGATRGMLSLSGAYTAGYYEAIDFLYSTGANPTARIAAYHDGNGSRLVFGTSNSYATGITNAAVTIDQAANVTFSGNTNICHLVAYSGGTTSCPAGYYTWTGTALASGTMLCCKVDNPV